MKLKQGLYKFAHRARRVFWKITQPVTAGTRVLLINEDKVLLVKHTYETQWYLPGGGVDKGETFEEALRREAREEIGAELGTVRLFGVYTNFYESKNDHIVIFICNEFVIKGNKDREIETFDFFDIDNLPENTSPGTRRRIEEYKRGKVNYFGKW